MGGGRQRRFSTRCSRRSMWKFHYAQYFDIHGQRRPPNKMTDWQPSGHLVRPPPPPLLQLVVISEHHSYCTSFYSRQRHRGRSTRLLLITAASRKQTSTTYFARDRGYWTAFSLTRSLAFVTVHQFYYIRNRRREPSKTGHINLITGYTFSKLV